MVLKEQHPMLTLTHVHICVVPLQTAGGGGAEGGARERLLAKESDKKGIKNLTLIQVPLSPSMTALRHFSPNLSLSMSSNSAISFLLLFLRSL